MARVACHPAGPGKAKGFVFLVLCLFGMACSNHSDTPPPGGSEPAGCVPGESFSFFELPFQLDYRTPGTLSFSLTCDELDGTFTLNSGTEFFQANTPYPGPGKRYVFPESGYLLYAFRIPVPEVGGSPCPGASVTACLSLSAKVGSKWLSGSAAIYCGSQTLEASPVKILRLSGQMEETDGGTSP